MKKIIFAFAFFLFTSLAFANISPVGNTIEITTSIKEDVNLEFSIDGTTEELLKEIESIMKMDNLYGRVKSCTVTVRIQDDQGRDISASFTADTCEAAGDAARGYITFLTSN